MTLLRELGNGPRDVDFDDDAFLKQFYGTLQIDTAGISANDLKGNANALSEFTKDWVNAIRRLPIKVKQSALPKPMEGTGDKKDAP